MGLYAANGTRYTKAGVPTSNDPDPIVTVTADVWRKHRQPFEDRSRTEGSLYGLWIAAGTKMRRSELDRMFADPQVDSVTPATGTTAGGTVVTIRGLYLDGVTGVTFGGTAGTALTLVSPSEIRVTTPAKTAGAVAVVVTNDSGPTTLAGGYTYA